MCRLINGVRRVAVIIIVVSVSGLTAACQKSNTPDTTESSLAKTPGLSMARHFQVSCDENNICNGDVGALFIATPQVGVLCTTFIIGEEHGHSVLATNKHCVEEVQHAAMQVAAVFPTNGKPPIVMSALQVLQTSPFNVHGAFGNPALVPDYAIIELNGKLPARPLPVSQDGLPFQKPIVIQTAEKQTGNAVKIAKVSCQTTNGPTYINAFYQTPQSPLVNLYKCSIRGGNSGSPIFNQNGEVAGIVQIGPKNVQGIDDLFQWTYALYGVDARDVKLENIGVGTNLSCIDLPAFGLTHPADQATCTIDPDKSMEILYETMAKRFNEIDFIKKILQNYIDFYHKNQNQPLFLWSFHANRQTSRRSDTDVKPFITFELAPTCVISPKDSHSYLNRYRSRRWGFWSEWEPQGSRSVQLPIWYAVLGMDPAGQPLLHTHKASEVVTYRFDPETISRTHPWDRAMIVSSVDNATPQIHILPFCSPTDKKQAHEDLQTAERFIQSGRPEDLKKLIGVPHDKGSSATVGE